MSKKREDERPPTLFPPHDLWQVARGDFGTPKDTPAVKLVREWMRAGEPARRPWALVMLGDTGVGKSVAAALAWLLLRDEDRAVAQAPGVFDDLRGVVWIRARTLQRMTWEQRGEVLQRCAAAHGLIVDELGSEDKNTRDALLEVLEERGDARRRTVLTSNLSGEDFTARYGDRFLDRIRAAGLTASGKPRWTRVFHGESLRGTETPASDEPTEPEGRPLTPAFVEEELRRAAPGVAALLRGTYELVDDGPEEGTVLVPARRAAGRDER